MQRLEQILLLYLLAYIARRCLLLNNRNLTIQDYFKQANAIGRHRPVRRSADGVLKGGPDDFTQTLKAVQSANGQVPQGRSIQDYMRNPIRALNRVHLDQTKDLSAADHPPALNKNHSKPQEDLQAVAQTRHIPPKRSSVEQRIEAGIEKAAAKYNLDPCLVNAVIRAESNYQVRAVSRAGAQGLMQLMPATAEEMGVRNPFNIEQNIDGGAKYLRRMLNQFDGDLTLALSAYNAGPGNVVKYNGQVPFAETRSYVARVLRYVKQSSRGAIQTS